MSELPPQSNKPNLFPDGPMPRWVGKLPIEQPRASAGWESVEVDYPNPVTGNRTMRRLPSGVTRGGRQMYHYRQPQGPLTLLRSQLDAMPAEPTTGADAPATAEAFLKEYGLGSADEGEGGVASAPVPPTYGPSGEEPSPNRAGEIQVEEPTAAYRQPGRIDLPEQPFAKDDKTGVVIGGVVRAADDPTLAPDYAERVEKATGRRPTPIPEEGLTGEEKVAAHVAETGAVGLDPYAPAPAAEPPSDEEDFSTQNFLERPPVKDHFDGLDAKTPRAYENRPEGVPRSVVRRSKAKKPRWEKPKEEE